MSADIQFDDWRPSKIPPPVSKMAKLVMGLSGGKVQSEEVANKILVGIALFFFVLSFIVLFRVVL